MDRNCTIGNLVSPTCQVALRKESVDRNIGVGTTRDRRGVALRKESVDRNVHAHIVYMPFGVALRKESVDRNFLFFVHMLEGPVSLSARRAWIEMVA